MASPQIQSTVGWVQTTIQTGGGLAAILLVALGVMAFFAGRKWLKENADATDMRHQADEERKAEMKAMRDALARQDARIDAANAFTRDTLVEVITDNKVICQQMLTAVQDLKDVAKSMHQAASRV